MKFGVTPPVSNHNWPELVETSSSPLSAENAAAVAPTTCFTPFSKVVTVVPLYRNTSVVFDIATAFPFGATASTSPGALMTVEENVFDDASTTINPAVLPMKMRLFC